MAARDGGSRFAPGPLLRRAEELRDRLRGEYAVQLADAQVVFADHALLQHDFPALRDGLLLAQHPHWNARPEPLRAELLRAERERLLLARAAVVSRAQAAQREANTRICTTRRRVRAWRPPRYGRALVTALPGGGLLDLKGVGVAPNVRPSARHHLTGLCTLSELLYGILIQWAIDALCARDDPRLFTVPMYALVDPGFDAWQPRLRTFEPAAIQVRRGHRRPRRGIELPRLGTRLEALKLEIELRLRRRGLTSTNPATRLDLRIEGEVVRVFYGLQKVAWLRPKALRRLMRRTRFDGRDLSFDGVNLQLTREVRTKDARAQLVDFGHFQVRERFTNPLASLAYKRLVRFGRALFPDQPGFVRPDPRRRLPFATWQPDKLVPEMDALARDWRRGRLTGAALREVLADKVESAVRRW